MAVINKELLEKCNKRYISQLNNYMRSMVSPNVMVETKNIKKKNKNQVRFDDTINIRYYDLDENERQQKELIYNQITMNLKIRMYSMSIVSN